MFQPGQNFLILWKDCLSGMVHVFTQTDTHTLTHTTCNQLFQHWLKLVMCSVHGSRLKWLTLLRENSHFKRTKSVFSFVTLKGEAAPWPASCVLIGCLMVSFKQFWKYSILMEKAFNCHLFLCVFHQTLPVSQWWRWLELFCVKISSHVPSVSRCSRTLSRLHVGTASVRVASHPTGMVDEGAAVFISVPFARSPSTNVRSFTSTAPWRKSRSSSSTSRLLEVQWKEEIVEVEEGDLGRILPRTLSWLWPQGQGRCQRASLLRWSCVSKEFRPQEHLKPFPASSSHCVQSAHLLPTTSTVTRHHPTTHYLAGTLKGPVYVDGGCLLYLCTLWWAFTFNRYTLSGPSSTSPPLPLCPIHQRDLEFFCRTDNICICSTCVDKADHRGHNITPAKREWQIKKVCVSLEITKT